MPTKTTGRGLIVVTCMSAVLIGCSPRFISGSPLADAVMEGIKSGTITSSNDLSFRGGGYKRFALSVFAEDSDFEFPSPALLGKMINYRQLESSDLEWILKNTNTNITDAAVIAAQKSLYDNEQRNSDPLKFGETRMINGRTVEGKFTYDERIGARKVTYTVETPTGFYKMTFVVDDKQIFAIDVHQ